jgi:PAS domain S-box-containing protein
MAKRTDDPADRQEMQGDSGQGNDFLAHHYRTAPIALCLIDRDLRYVCINEKLAEMNGFPVAHHIGRTLREIIPEFAELVEPYYRQVLESGQPIVDFEIYSPTPAEPGVEKYWRIGYYPFFDAEDRITGVSTVVQDITDIKRAQEQLETSETRFRALVEQAPDAIVVLDPETGRFVDCNQNALSLFGLEREALLRVGPLDVSPAQQPDGRPSAEISRTNRAAAVRGDHLTFSWTHRHADGRLIPCEVRLVRLPGEDPVLLRGSIVDITERVRAEQALQLSEARNRSLVENAPDATVVLDVETGHFVDLNENAVKLFGLSRERMLQIGPADVSPEFQPDGSRSDEMARSRVATALQDGGVVTFEWTHGKPDGSLVPCEIRLLRLPGHDGRLVHGAVTDITERKRGELARQQNENRLRMLVESTDAVPWEADLETWMFTYIGPQAERLFGFPPEKWFEKGFWESRIHPEDRESAMRFCRQSSEERENYAFEYRMITASGEIIWIHDLVSVEQGTAGTPPRLRGFMLDVTARKRAEMLQTGQKRVLERLARGEPLGDVLCELAHTIDGLQTGMKCSILLLDPEGKELRHGAAPHLPEDYNVLVDGLMIGPAAGSCGTAAFRGERVIVSDISTDPLWEKYRHVALRFDLRSCWSQPILSQTGAVLGTLAVYHEYPNHPSASELEMIEQAAYIAGIAIERQRSVAALRTSEAALRRSQADLQHLAGRLISAQEEERRRLARELHDDLTQRLAVLAIEAGKLEGKPDAPVKVLRDGLCLIRDEMVQLSEDVHGMSRQLHPALLEDLGLVDALESECERFSERESIKTTFRAVRIPADIPPDVALCFYRVAQECLRNIGKHSGAKKARVELRGNKDAMQLSIRDDGGGFDPLYSQGRGGVGLASMGERIRLVNGSLGVRSRAGRGTTIEVRVPLPGDARLNKEDRSKPAAGAGAAPRAKTASRAARPARRKTRSRRTTPRTASTRRRRTPRTT